MFVYVLDFMEFENIDLEDIDCLIMMIDDFEVKCE